MWESLTPVIGRPVVALSLLQLCIISWINRTGSAYDTGALYLFLLTALSCGLWDSFLLTALSCGLWDSFLLTALSCGLWDSFIGLEFRDCHPALPECFRV